MKNIQFKNFTTIVAIAIDTLTKESINGILYTKGSNNTNPYNIYSEAIPEEHNPIFLKNRTYDCSCCKNFINKFTYLFVKDYTGKIVTLWDVVMKLLQDPISIDGSNVPMWLSIAHALNKNSYSNKSEPIMFRGNTKYFLSASETYSDKVNKFFDHFYIQNPLPAAVPRDIENKFKHTIKKFREINFDHPEINNLLNVIVDKNIYRHEDLDASISAIKLLATNDDVFYSVQRNLIEHSNSLLNSTAHELLKNVIEYGLEVGVTKYEKMVAGENYRRPKALVTTKDLNITATALKDKNMSDSVGERRFIKLSDMKDNSIYFDKKSNPIKEKKTKKKAKKSLLDGIPTADANADKNKNTKPEYKEIKLDNFLQDVIPGADWVGVLAENRLIPNKVDITVPMDDTKPQVTKWDSGISWTYNGNIPESSITERVKSAGGNVDGDIRCSLSWNDEDDLDIHASICKVKNDNSVIPIDEIFYNHKRNANAGIELDVDMNATQITPNPVENICITDVNKFFSNYNNSGEDVYVVFWVNNFRIRTTETKDSTYAVELKVNDKIYNIKSTLNKLPTEYTDAIRIGDSIFTSHIGPIACCLRIDKNGKIEVNNNDRIHTITTPTNAYEFVKVQAIFNSPEEENNKHTFFVLKDKVEPHDVQCLHTTMLKDELYENRKALHYIFQNNMLEGNKKQKLIYGFSYSKENHFLARVDKNGKIYKYKVNINS